MNENNTNWTPFPDDNLLGIIDKGIINEYEAKGIAKAELYVFELDVEVPVSTSLSWRFTKLLLVNCMSGRVNGEKQRLLLDN